MKFLKYLAIVAAVVGLLAAASWYLRNTLIQRLSSPLLKEYDIEIVDVSLDSLAASQARISRLKLLYAKTTTIEIEGLTTRFKTQNNTYRAYSADRVAVVTEAQGDEKAVELARLVDQFHSLTNTFPRTELFVGELSLPPYPIVHGLNWVLSDTTQEIRATIGSMQIAITDTPVDVANFQVRVSMPGPPGADELTIVSNILQGEQAISISGEAALDLPSWQPLAKLAGLVPDEVEIKSGTAELRFDTQIPYDVSQSPSTKASLNPTSPWQIDYTGKSGETTEMTIRNAGAAEIDATFPTVEWSLSMPQASLTVSDGDWKAIPVALRNLSCSSTLQCEVNADLSWAGAILPFGKADNINLSSTLLVSFQDAIVHVDVAPEAMLSIKALSSDASDIGLINATLASAARLTVSDTGWTFSADSLDTSIGSLSAGENVLVTTDVFLEKISVTDVDETTTASLGLYAPGIRAVLGDQTIELPGVKGSATANGANFLFNLETIGLQQNGHLTVRHNIDRETGDVKIDRATASFASKKMSERYRPWRNDWDLVGGLVGMDAEAKWRKKGTETVFDGKVALKITEAAGYYADTIFAGLSTDLAVTYSEQGALTTEPGSLKVALVEMGLPIENLSADYRLDLNDLSAEIENLRMTAFGGTVRADPFSFRTGSERNNLTLHADLIRLDEVLSLKEFEAVSVTGNINATLPVTIENGEITVTGGRLFGEAPGGVIRYRAANAPSVTSTSSIDLVSRALSNFVYETLTSEVDYNEAGDLILKMQIKGRNPDMEGNRPVILNLGVENNVPQMLRSLQAARAVEEVLEKRVKK